MVQPQTAICSFVSVEDSLELAPNITHMESALVKASPVGSGGPALGAGARGGVDCLELELVASVQHDDEVDETVEAGKPGADAALWVGGGIGDEERGGEVDALAQDVLAYGGGVRGARLTRENVGDKGAKVCGGQLGVVGEHGDRAEAKETYGGDVEGKGA